MVSHPRQTENKRPADLCYRCLAPRHDRFKMRGRCLGRPGLHQQQLDSRWTGAPAKGLVAGGAPTPEASTPSSSLRQACPSLSPTWHLHIPSGRSGRGLPSFLGPVGPWAGAASGSPGQFLPFKKDPESPVLRWSDFFKWFQGSRDCLSMGYRPLATYSF